MKFLFLIISIGFINGNVYSSIIIFQNACKNNHAGSCFLYAKKLKEQNSPDAKKIFEKGCSLGHQKACAVLDPSIKIEEVLPTPIPTSQPELPKEFATPIPSPTVRGSPLRPQVWPPSPYVFAI